MKEICGYVDTSGKFHKTSKECEIADAKLKIEEITRRLDNFSSEIHEILFLNGSKFSENPSRLEWIERNIYLMVSTKILQHSDAFLEVIELSKTLKKELDYLKEDKGYKYKWWLKLAWWSNK